MAMLKAKSSTKFPLTPLQNGIAAPFCQLSPRFHGDVKLQKPSRRHPV